jgi:transposase-like protein
MSDVSDANEHRRRPTRPVWKCSGCSYQFSVTAGTIFADRKRPIRDYLLAIAIFTNGAKGHSALQMTRPLGSLGLWGIQD